MCWICNIVLAMLHLYQTMDASGVIPQRGSLLEWGHLDRVDAKLAPDRV